MPARDERRITLVFDSMEVKCGQIFRKF